MAGKKETKWATKDDVRKASDGTAILLIGGAIIAFVFILAMAQQNGEISDLHHKVSDLSKIDNRTAMEQMEALGYHKACVNWTTIERREWNVSDKDIKKAIMSMDKINTEYPVLVVTMNEDYWNNPSSWIEGNISTVQTNFVVINATILIWNETYCTQEGMVKDVFIRDTQYGK